MEKYSQVLSCVPDCTLQGQVGHEVEPGKARVVHELRNWEDEGGYWPKDSQGYPQEVNLSFLPSQ